ncbi:MAG: HlyC/CorC family transporter [Alphaproteobacteria bacterium]
MNTELLITIGAIIILIVLSAFFASSETALTAASRLHIHQLAKEGDRRAQIARILGQQKERLIGTLLLANNLVNILASALATSTLIALFGDRGVVYATAIMTVLILVFGEVLPKTYAINNADRTALRLAPAVRALVIVLSPITHAVQVFVTATLRVFGVKSTVDIGVTTPEELRGAIDLHAGPGETIRHERAMLRSILDLDQVDVGEIMIHRNDMAMIDADEPLDRIIDQVLASPYTRLPLFSGQPDNIVGILHAKTVIKAVYEKAGHVEDIDIRGLAAKPWFIPESTSLIHQLQAFRRRREHFALVVDEYGSLMGIVTLEDILEEIVGDISDEYDQSIAGVWPQPDGSIIVSGNTTIRDLNRRFDWPLPDEEAATVAGLVIHEARRLPEVGQIFTFFGFRFEILRRKRNQITSIRIIPPRSSVTPASH